ncbi:YihY/virulence factor BrkB family protein [Variovorax atrisoli]|uniref:YihY/virulence factor BrkB family protein n=1 Tax=Variovorax atrisoli TaxID=3394203 RepID=UPI001616A5A0|nr:YihY/virulence factor BrkB family protein [Variovorax sp. BK613]MBB3641600.1 membrane protein [Variovorax sp. BK613]
MTKASLLAADASGSPRSVRLLPLCKEAISAWIDDLAPSMGAAIAYYTMFSLAPLLIIVIAVAGALFGTEAVQGQIAAQLSGLVGEEGALAVQGLIRSASEPERGLIAGAISIIVLVVGATTVFAELQSALDRIWHVPERAKPHGVWGVLRARVLSFGLILGLAFMLMVSLVVSAALAALGTWSTNLVPGWELMLQGLNLLVSLTILTVLFAMIFKFMPSAPIAWRDVWTGAAVTAVLFEIGKVLIGLYLGKSGVNESFAAAGSLVVLLAWVYYAAQIFLLGAEFTKVYAHAHGSVAASKAQAATQETARQAEAGTDDVERTPRSLREPSEAHAAVERKELIVAIASRVIVVAGLAMLRSLLSGRRRTSRARHRRGPT